MLSNRYLGILAGQSSGVYCTNLVTIHWDTTAVQCWERLHS